VRRRPGSAANGDAAVIESSWREPERFAVLFDRHAPHIYRYLARRAGQQVADDLVAETFLAAFAKRDRYDLGHPDARPWLYGIATNLVSRHRRDEARQYRIWQATAAEPQLPGHAERVAADVTAQAVRALLDGALAGLSAGDRDVLLLIAWEQRRLGDRGR
jgi:RNA polymerase sigma-70 factor (ECF subfamily)